MPISRTIDGKTITVYDEDRQKTEVWSRVIGYYRPKDEFNIGKKAEFAERKMYKVNEPEMLKTPQQQLEL
jgi:hypothetical protein